MPSEDLHSRLMAPTGVRNYVAIPTLASWKGDVVSAMHRLKRFLRKEQFEAQQEAADFHRQAFAKQFHDHAGGPAGTAQIKRFGLVAPLQPKPVQQPPSASRIAGNLTNPDVIDAAIGRYQAGTLQAGEPNNQISKAIHGSLLVDIYTVTGQFMGTISRNPKLRTDNDCALFPFYRALHWAAADAFGKVFGIDGDEIDMYLRKQLIVMSEGGVYCDNHVFNQTLHVDAAGNSVPQLCYLSDEEALACRLHIRDGKFMIINAQGALEPFDCSGPEYQTENTAYEGKEFNRKRGVAGFAMGLNRHIYARKHSIKDGPRGSFYHSSYLEGREVLCTGCLTVVDGELTYINNWSGHYKPSPIQLALVLEALRAQGVDIEKTVVEYEYVDEKDKNKVKNAFQTSGTVFLKMKLLGNLKEQQAERDAKQAKQAELAAKQAELAAKQAEIAAKQAELKKCANRIRAALTEYEARSKGKFTWQSKKSTRAKTRLLKIGQDDETLLKEVGFTLYPYLLTNWPSLKPIESPLRTGPADQYQRGETSELLTRLVDAFRDYLGPATR
jgi:hypothetical protein